MGKKKCALIIVDVQPFFIGDADDKATTGATVVPIVNQLIDIFDYAICACHNWKPGVADFQPHPKLKLDHRTIFLHKEEQSAFTGFIYNSHRDQSKDPNWTLASFLKRENVGHLFVCGLFTEYCVMRTAVDGPRNNISTHVIVPACAETNAGGEERHKRVKDALNEMRVQGCTLWTAELFRMLEKSLGEKEVDRFLFGMGADHKDKIPPYPSLGSMGGGSGREMQLQDAWEAKYGNPEKGCVPRVRPVGE